MNIWDYARLDIDTKAHILEEDGEYHGENKYGKEVYQLYGFYVTTGHNKEGNLFFYVSQQEPE